MSSKCTLSYYKNSFAFPKAKLLKENLKRLKVHSNRVKINTVTHQREFECHNPDTGCTDKLRT